MQPFQGRPATRERISDDSRRQYASAAREPVFGDSRITGEPAKYNVRSEQRRISWENDLYERQSS